MGKPTITVQPIHFEDFDGSQFERLAFAYHARTDKWRSLEWYGQVGSDLGRDIWGVRDHDQAGTVTVCIQCVNRETLTFAKAERDIDKAVKGPNGVPDTFRFVTRANVSADMRDKIKQHASSKSIKQCDIWSGTEFEEKLRNGAESLLKRFVEGELFPDAANELRMFAQTTKPLNDCETLSLMAKLFDRPAFYTPIHQESSLPAFKQAITDTIQALGTGILRTRDGEVIARIPSRHQLSDPTLQKKIQGVEKALAKLRAKFDELTRTGAIRPCGCDQPDCPVFMVADGASQELDRLRREALLLFRDAYPQFDEPAPW